jgi:hypothetical protein
MVEAVWLTVRYEKEGVRMMIKRWMTMFTGAGPVADARAGGVAQAKQPIYAAADYRQR